MSLLPQLVRSQHLLLTRTAPVGRLLRPATRHIFDYRPTKPLTDRMDEYTKKTKNGKEPNPQLFGYPELPTEYLAHRDPRGGWWNAQERRNFGEVLQVDHETLQVWAPDYPKPSAISYRAGLYFFGGLIAFGYGVYYACFAGYRYPDQVYREFPHDGNLNAVGGYKKFRYPVFRGIDPADEFEGSQKEYYESRAGRRDGRYY